MLIIGWLFACYGLIISRAPHLKDEFDKVIPYQGFFGIVLLILGLIDLFYFRRTISLFQSSVIFGVLQILNLVTKLVLWLVLSSGLVTKYLLTSKKDPNDTTQKIYNSLILVQVPFGIMALLLGLIGLVFNIIY